MIHVLNQNGYKSVNWARKACKTVSSDFTRHAVENTKYYFNEKE